MNDIYHPITGEHIRTDNPSDWMEHAGIEAPNYDPDTQGCFWRNGAWEVVTAQPDPPTEKDFIDVIQAHLDAAARLKGYDGIISACSYAAAPNAFQAEGVKFLGWRAEVWAYGYAEMAKVKAGTRAMPTTDQFVGELPPLVL